MHDIAVVIMVETVVLTFVSLLSVILVFLGLIIEVFVPLFFLRVTSVFRGVGYMLGPGAFVVILVAVSVGMAIASRAARGVRRLMLVVARTMFRRTI